MKITIPNLLEIARRAYYWTSFTPDERAARTVESYENELNQDILTMDEEEQKRYIPKYTQHLLHWLNAHSRCASSAITGGSNFPVRKQEKYNNWERSSYAKFRDFRERALKAIEKKNKVTTDPLEEAISSLEKLKATHETMKKVNALIRKGATKEDLFQSGLLSSKSAEEILKPSSNGVVGFEQFQLINSNANIKRLDQRVKELQSKDTMKTSSNLEFVFTGGKVLINFEMDRIQIIHDQKPDMETIGKLKKRAFKWSPSQQLWQRLITINCIHDTENLVNIPMIQIYKKCDHREHYCLKKVL